jgi:type II secretory pathway pseudopilin PulG
MNLRSGPYHKIWRTAAPGLEASSGVSSRPAPTCEGGYTLVALLAVMTVLALFAMAAAPSLRQQSQRERELEAIFRGEQVADAIRLYYSYQQGRMGRGDAALPTTIDQLLEGLPRGSKNVQILRASAARDPLSDSAEWRLIKPRTSELADFQRSLLLFAENVRPPTNDPQLKAVEAFMAPPVLSTLGIASTSGSSSVSDNSSGPFIGVASSSERNSVISYYGIGRHADWIFTPLFR